MFVSTVIIADAAQIVHGVTVLILATAGSAESIIASTVIAVDATQIICGMAI